VPVEVIDGYATTLFSPGKFAVYGDPGYNQAATGQVVATATWTNKAGTITKTRDITLVWKNYPYISTSSLGNCGNSLVGDKINITIQLAGDGAGLWPKPIDVSLAIDQSLSMRDTMGTATKMNAAIAAANTFVDQMDSKNKIGLVAYGSSSNAYFSINLTTNHASVKTKISALKPDMYTPTRKALYYSISDLIDHRNPDPYSIQAVILMTDGEFNYYGDPLARGTGYDSAHPRTEGTGHQTSSTYYAWTSTDIDRHTYFSGLGGIVNSSGADVGTYQDMSLLAKDKNIRIYTISFTPTKDTTTPTWITMDTLSSTTNGKHYWAGSAAELAQIYTNIAGDLQETAGGETQVDLDFGTVMINDYSANNITEYMDYEYHEGYSTYINKFNITKYGDYYSLFSETRRDDDAWHAGTMAFDVGTIKLNETWRAIFQLNLTRAGKIDLFGPGSSTITFKDYSTTPPTTQTGFIPAMQCRVRQSIVNTGFGSKTLLVDHLSFVEGASPDPNVWTIKWNTTYDGDKTVQEAILYRVTGDTQWKTIPGGLIFISTKVFEETKEHTISTSDTALWPPGKCFDIQVVAGAEDANAAMTNPITKCKALPGGTIFIKLE
jgi:hypothetical protein